MAKDDEFKISAFMLNPLTGETRAFGADGVGVGVKSPEPEPQSGCDCPACTIARVAKKMGIPPSMLASGAEVPRHEESEEKKLAQELAEYLSDADADVRWDHVVGNAAAREALREAVEYPHTHKALHAHYGVRAARGAVLHGPPGCGKTMLAKAVAGALAKLHDERVPLLRINGSEVQQAYVGQTEEIIRAMFAYSRLYHKRTGRQIVIFIDEADAMLPARGAPGTYGFQTSNVSTFLTEMDGLEGETGAFVLLATNRLSAIEPAVMRDGRCDRVIKIVRPDLPTARIIVRGALEGAPVSGATADALAEHATRYFFDPVHRLPCAVQNDDDVQHVTLGHVCSGAMMVGLVERAKKVAVARDRAAGTVTGLTVADFDAAVISVRDDNASIFPASAIEEMIEALGATARLREGLKMKSDDKKRVTVN